MAIDSTLLTPDPDDTVAVVIYCRARYAEAVHDAALEEKRAHEHAEDDDTSAIAGIDYSPPFDGRHGGKNAWSLPGWDPDTDREAMRWLQASYAPEQLKALARIVVAGSDGVATREALRFGEYKDTHSAGPIMRWLTNRFRRVGRTPIWNGTDAQQDGSQIPFLRRRARADPVQRGPRRRPPRHRRPGRRRARTPRRVAPQATIVVATPGAAGTVGMQPPPRVRGRPHGPHPSHHLHPLRFDTATFAAADRAGTQTASVGFLEVPTATRAPV